MEPGFLPIDGVAAAALGDIILHRKSISVVVRPEAEGDPNLLQIAHAADTFLAFASLWIRLGADKKSGEQGQYCQNDHQFDEGEGMAIPDKHFQKLTSRGR